MKRETFEKAAELSDRINGLDAKTNVVSHPRGCSGLDWKDNELVLRSMDVGLLTNADAQELAEHIDKWLKAKRAKLQKEFDQLK